MNLLSLPVELLYTLFLFSLNESLASVNKHLYVAFKLSTPAFRAQYLIARFEALQTSAKDQGIITRALRYPVCDLDVLRAILKNPTCPPLVSTSTPELPRRLFKPLSPRPADSSWSRLDAPLPFLMFLYNSDRIRQPDPNSHDGYALTRAVHAGFLPLVSFLLEHGASPIHKKGLAVKVAIHKKNLPLVRMLIEPDTHRSPRTAKRRKKEDRIACTDDFLREAVKVDARDIVEYLVKEKGVAPNIRTLGLIRT